MAAATTSQVLSSSASTFRQASRHQLRQSAHSPFLRFFSPDRTSSRQPKVQRRFISDLQTFRSSKGSVKVDLRSRRLVGVAQSRGERPYQEDAWMCTSLEVDSDELRQNVQGIKEAKEWSRKGKEKVDFGAGEDGSKNNLEQVAYFAVFDGHGTDQVSHYLRDNLHTLIESSQKSQIPEVVKSYREIGGYLRRFKGGQLERLINDKGTDTKEEEKMGLDDSMSLAFLQADQAVLNDTEIKASGCVATIATLHSLTIPSEPFFASSLLALTVAHVGDTRALLCMAKSGRATLLTETHHADSRVESERLRRVGTGLVTDSFGESRWGGALANTRGIGDKQFKKLGVTGEPDIIKRVLKGDEVAFLVLVSDGISEAMSDQEIVDLCRGHQDPTKAAEAIVKFAEDVGGEDNMTSLVIPFQSWGKVGGTDTTSSRREFRLRQASGQSGRQKRM